MSDVLWLSLGVTALALALVVPVGGAMGWWLSRARGPLRAVLDACVLVPLVLPPSVTGYYLLVLFGAEGVLGAPLKSALGVRLVFTPVGAALAASVVSLPLMAKGAEAAFLRVDRALVEVARANGLRAFATFRLVTLPLAIPGLAVATTLTAIRAFGEFGATWTFAGYAEGRTSTAPLELYVALQSGDDARAGRLALVMTAVSATVAIALGIWGRRTRSS